MTIKVDRPATPMWKSLILGQHDTYGPLVVTRSNNGLAIASASSRHVIDRQDCIELIELLSEWVARR